MRHLVAAVMASLLLAGPAQSQSVYWRDPSGMPVAETESMKSKDGFGGWLLATTDEDWEKKWNSPPEAKPNFARAGTVPYGKKVFILTFFGNPKRDRRGNVNVRCDLRISSPAGNVALAQKDMICFAGQIKGNPYHLRLSAPVIGFSGDAGDPSGIWVVEVVLRDAVRNVELPLRTTFALKKQ
jgi:hypothetical protein